MGGEKQRPQAARHDGSKVGDARDLCVRVREGSVSKAKLVPIPVIAGTGLDVGGNDAIRGPESIQTTCKQISKVLAETARSYMGKPAAVKPTKHTGMSWSKQAWKGVKTGMI